MHWLSTNLAGLILWDSDYSLNPLFDTVFDAESEIWVCSLGLLYTYVTS